MADNLDVTDEDMIEDFVSVLEDRMWSIEMMEPECGGETYDRWDERYSSISDIYDNAASLLDYEDINDRKDILNDIQNDLFSHQLDFGGLKRFR